MTRLSRHRSVGTSLAATGSTCRDLHSGNRSGRYSMGYREKSLVLTSALHEYRRLRGEGKSVSVQEFCDKFPSYRKSLLRLIDVEENLGDLGEMPDPFPVVGGEFLGFEILDELGMGAIARVYLAAEPELGGRRVVIKVSADGTDEAATLGKLQHPNIVQVYSVKREAESGMTAVCMPYQGSATLTDVLDLVFQEGSPPESANVISDVASRLADMEALRDDDLAKSTPDPILVHGSFVDGVVHLGIQLVDALEYAHSSGVLHRDLKPSNILLTPHGRPMLLDFNLSFDADQDAMPRGGTLPYMAPEQIRASIRGTSEAKVDPRSDIFSLGVILYELLTGKLPYGGPPEHLGPEAASLWQINAHDTRPVPIREVNPQVPIRIAETIERCLVVDPNQRTGTLAEVAGPLRAHFSRTQRAARWVRRHRGLCQAVLIAVIMALTATGAFFALRPPLYERLFQEAMQNYKRGDVDEAIRLCTETLNRQPRHLNALLLRGVACLEAKKRYPMAAADFGQASRIAPSAAVWDHLGCAAYHASNDFKAASYFENAIAIVPNDARLHLKYAVTLMRQRSTWDSALEHTNKAIALGSQIGEAYLVHGETIVQRPGTKDDLVDDMKTALELLPKSKTAFIHAANLLSFVVRENRELEPLIQNYLEEAVDLGASSAAIDSNNIHQVFGKKLWLVELKKRAVKNASVEQSATYHIMVPSILFDFENLQIETLP